MFLTGFIVHVGFKRPYVRFSGRWCSPWSLSRAQTTHRCRTLSVQPAQKNTKLIFDSMQWFFSQSTHRVATTAFWCTFIMMKKLAQAGGGWRCTPTPFHYSYHHVQSCSVRSSEWADTITLFHLYQYMYSVVFLIRYSKSTVHYWLGTVKVPYISTSVNFCLIWRLDFTASTSMNTASSAVPQIRGMLD